MKTTLIIFNTLVALALWVCGFAVGRMFDDASPLVIHQIAPEQAHIEAQYHDAAFATPITGMLALAVASEHYPLPMTEGDMGVLRIDRKTGRVLAKCE